MRKTTKDDDDKQMQELQQKLHEMIGKDSDVLGKDVLDLSKPLKHSYPNIKDYDKIVIGKTSDNLP